MKWVRLVKTHCPESKQNSTNNNNNNANVRAVTVPCTTTAKRGFAETLEPVGIAFASPKRAEPACRTSTPQQGAETCPPPPQRRIGHKSPRTVLSSQGKEKVISWEERQGREKETPSTEWEEEEGKRDGEAGTLLSIFADAARTSGPITASHRLSRPLHVLHAGRLAVTFKCHFQMPALAKWLQNAVFMLVGGE